MCQLMVTQARSDTQRCQHRPPLPCPVPQGREHCNGSLHGENLEVGLTGNPEQRKLDCGAPLVCRDSWEKCSSAPQSGSGAQRLFSGALSRSREYVKGASWGWGGQVSVQAQAQAQALVPGDSQVWCSSGSGSSQRSHQRAAPDHRYPGHHHRSFAVTPKTLTTCCGGTVQPLRWYSGSRLGSPPSCHTAYLPECLSGSLASHTAGDRVGKHLSRKHVLKTRPKAAVAPNSTQFLSRPTPPARGARVQGWPPMSPCSHPWGPGLNP